MMNLDNPEWTRAFEYSEWLDQQGVLHDDNDDGRSHEDLVNEFFAEQSEGDD